MLDNLMILVQAPPVIVDLLVNGLLIGAIFAMIASILLFLQALVLTIVGLVFIAVHRGAFR